LKLRCSLDECRTIKIPAGTAMGAAITAGAVKVWSEIIAIAFEDVAVDSSNDSVADSVWIVYAPKIVVVKDADTGLTWSVGEKVYYNGTDFTGLVTNLAPVGYALETKLATDTSGMICFMGDNIAVTPDIAAGA